MASPADKSSSENIALERYRLRIGLLKVVFGTFIVGLAGVLIPGAVQFWSLHFEDQRKRLELELQATTQHQLYVKDFLTTALNQDIELRIRFAQYFTKVSPEPFKKDWNNFLTTLLEIRNSNRTIINQKEAEIRRLLALDKRTVEQQTSMAQLERELEWQYREIGYVAKDRSIVPSKEERAASSSFRVARSLLTLRDQINEMAPTRNKANDGTVASPSLDQPNQRSDHIPWVRDGEVGIVTALDITDDPAHGVSAERIVEALRASHDPRIKYVIWNGRIFDSTISAWNWRPYAGANKHKNYFHISVSSDKGLYDSTAPWNIGLGEERSETGLKKP